MLEGHLHIYHHVLVLRALLNAAVDLDFADLVVLENALLLFNELPLIEVPMRVVAMTMSQVQALKSSRDFMAKEFLAYSVVLDHIFL